MLNNKVETCPVCKRIKSKGKECKNCDKITVSEIKQPSVLTIKSDNIRLQHSTLSIEIGLKEALKDIDMLVIDGMTFKKIKEEKEHRPTQEELEAFFEGK